MTFAELLLGVMAIVGVYYLLRPLQRSIEGFVLRLLGVRGPRILDATVVNEKNSKL